jgi:hypothetical protein
MIFEHPADQPLGRPVDEPDRTARAADPDKLGRDDGVPRGELDAEDREDFVERRAGEREIFGVSHHELELDSGPVGAVSGDVEQLGHEIEPGHLGRARCFQRHVAGSGGDVEDLVAGIDADGREQMRRRDVIDVLGDARVVACRPRGAVDVLQCCDGIGGRGAHAHLLLACW